MPDSHEFSANHMGGVPVLGGLNHVHESKYQSDAWIQIIAPEYQSDSLIQTYKPNIIEADSYVKLCQVSIHSD